MFFFPDGISCSFDADACGWFDDDIFAADWVRVKTKLGVRDHGTEKGTLLLSGVNFSETREHLFSFESFVHIINSSRVNASPAGGMVIALFFTSTLYSGSPGFSYCNKILFSLVFSFKEKKGSLLSLVIMSSTG